MDFRASYFSGLPRIIFYWLTASILIGAIVAVLGSVAEEPALNTVPVPAGQVVLLADGLLGVEQRLDLLLPGLCVAVPDGGLPVASLLLDVEGQASWATNGLEALKIQAEADDYEFIKLILRKSEMEKKMM